MSEEHDNIDEFEAHETARRLPLGWVILFVGLVIWGGYYIVKYTPAISGWTQEGAYEESLDASEK